jgi:SAM-dependent methyltransferase
VSVTFDGILLRSSVGSAARDRSSFQRAFCERVLREPGFAGAVLDVGCGEALPAALEPLSRGFGRLDGVDPSPGISSHPLLAQHWTCRVEDAPIPRAAYDLAYAYNVVEHVADPEPFLRKVHASLKPGGVFWALTPHGRHPFAYFSRALEVVGAKRAAGRYLAGLHGRQTVNEYSAFYRLNTVARVQKLARTTGFSTCTFDLWPCIQWDMYFPRLLRCLPHAYDAMLGTRFRPFMQILMFRLQKP